MLSPLSSLEIGHDNSGLGPGWYLDQVIVYCPNTGIEQVFPCKKWLSRDEGDGLIQRTLYENTSLRKKGDKSKCLAKRNEPSHEKKDLSFVQLIVLQTGIRSNPVG